MPSSIPKKIKTNHRSSQYHKPTLMLILLGLYFILWSIFPVFLSSSVPLDVSEGINWGHEYQLGYYKHPPLSSWILYNFYQVFGHFGPYLLSQLHVLVTLILVYLLGRNIMPKPQALLGTLLTLGVVYYSYSSLEFNHNVAQFPIWAGLSLLFYHCVTHNRYRDWILLGILGGLGMLTKYSVAFLLIPMAIYLLCPAQWQLLKTPKPWLSAVIMLALFAPHLNWLIENDWLPFTYASARASEKASTSLEAHFSWFNFSVTQLVVHLPLLVMLILSRKYLQFNRITKHNLKNLTTSPSFDNYTDTNSTTFNNGIVWYLWLSPLLFLIFISLIFGVGLRDMWGMPMWSLSGLIAASLIPPNHLALMTQKLSKYIAVWLAIVTVLTMTYLQFGHQLRGKPSRMDWPEQALSLQAQQTWDSLSHCPWDSVSGEGWLTALIAMNAESSPYATTSTWPSQMINGPANYSPWMTPTRLQQQGTLIVSRDGDKPELPLVDSLDKDSMVYHQGEWQINWSKQPNAEPLIVQWQAYVPKSCAK